MIQVTLKKASLRTFCLFLLTVLLTVGCTGINFGNRGDTSNSPTSAPDKITTSNTDRSNELHDRIEQISRAAQGRVGMTATVLETGESVSLNGNQRFPMRSVYKFPHQYLDKSPIAATSILNGAFADEILSYNTPLYNVENYSVGYWGDKFDWKIDFTTMDNTADYTAAAALDSTTPKILRIASFQISPNELVSVGKEVKNREFKLVPMGSLEDFSASNKKERAAHPEGEKEVFPGWQNKQYLYSMFSVQNTPLDNDRYPDVRWTSAIDVLSKI